MLVEERAPGGIEAGRCQEQAAGSSAALVGAAAAVPSATSAVAFAASVVWALAGCFPVDQHSCSPVAAVAVVVVVVVAAAVAAAVGFEGQLTGSSNSSQFSGTFEGACSTRQYHGQFERAGRESGLLVSVVPKYALVVAPPGCYAESYCTTPSAP